MIENKNESPDLTNEIVNDGDNKLIDLLKSNNKNIFTLSNFQPEIIENQVVENIEEKVLLISRLDHPEYITYNGYQKRLSPRHRELVFESLITNDLPNGVQTIKEGTK